MCALCVSAWMCALTPHYTRWKCSLLLTPVHVYIYVSYSRDDQRGGEEQSSQQASPTVCVFPLALVHLAAAVIAAAAHAEEDADYRNQNGEHQAERRTDHEADLIVDGLGSAGEE